MNTIYQKPQTLVHDFRCGQHLLYASGDPQLDPPGAPKKAEEPF